MREHIAQVEPEPAQRSASEWLLWVLVAGVAGLIVAGVVVTLVVSRQPPHSYPAGTPTGTVQRYLALLQKGEVDRAYEMTSRWEPRSAYHAQFDGWGQVSHQVVLVRSTTGRRYSTVTVEISTFSAGPAGPSGDTAPTTFTLHRSGRRWQITGPEFIPSS